LKKLFSILSFINHHPLAGKNKLAAYSRFFRWQLKQAVSPGPRICPFVEDSVLLVEKNMAGATGNIYCGLLEFEDMAFVLHFLRPGDLMGDIGANVGAYTILAAKNTGAKVIALEPVPAAFQHLEANVKLNKIKELATLVNCGAAAGNAELEFTAALDAVNHVAVPVEVKNNMAVIKVRVKPLDEIFTGKAPLLLKIDVEGFEQSVIEGAKTLLESADLKAIIIELNGSGMRYGFSDEKINEELLALGFKPFQYDPFSRQLKYLEKPGPFNTIYLKNLEWIRERIATARNFNILGHTI
jgi:FkbM family methyltransferase